MWIVPFYKPVIQTPTWTDQVSIESLERRMATKSKTPRKGPFLKHKGHKRGFVHSVSFERNLKDFERFLQLTAKIQQQSMNENIFRHHPAKVEQRGAEPAKVMGGVI